MTVTHNRDEILSRANRFAKEFADAQYEMGEAQNFIRGLCDVFGFSNKRLVSFEHRVKKLDGRRGRIDGFYPGKLLIEMKSRGEDLAEAYRQATDYLPGLPQEELPDYFLISDFENLHLYDVSAHTPPLQHKLPDFSKYIDSYLFLAGYEAQAQKEQIAVDESAARKIAEGLPYGRLANQPERSRNSFIRCILCEYWYSVMQMTAAEKSQLPSMPVPAHGAPEHHRLATQDGKIDLRAERQQHFGRNMAER
jgi:hypothetical protein